MHQTKRSIHILGAPSERQRQFFAAKTKYIAYGGARGGGKSWALRRKLIGLCLHYPGLRALLVRRSYAELKENHLGPFFREYGELLSWSEGKKELSLPNGSHIIFGFCASDRDLLRYQGQEYDIIAIDEATALSEYRFEALGACLRGTSDVPRRIYLTCNPGGIGHGWVKRLFIDRRYREGEDPSEYTFIPASVYDNGVLMRTSPGYVKSLERLPPKLREAWLYGRWDVFEGQFFPEFDRSRHICPPSEMGYMQSCFIAFDYGFDMLAALLLGVGEGGRLYVISELCVPDLTLSQAAERISALARSAPLPVAYAVASPDLWNRRQDSGRSGFEIMQAAGHMPPMIAADSRRVPGWRILRERLCGMPDGRPGLMISERCVELIRSLEGLLCNKSVPEDASGEPHELTHAPEALRYAVMSRYDTGRSSDKISAAGDYMGFTFPQKRESLWGI